MGTPEFAVTILDGLLNHGVNVVGVITAPDRPAGRGRKLNESAVKKYAVEKGLKILQPLKLKDEDFVSELKSLNADLQIVVAFRMLPEIVWNMPEKGTFNLHASLLPNYRGAAPINWAVINGEKESGVTTFFIEHKIDTGNILFQEKVAISDTMSAGELHDELMITGSKLVNKTYDAIAEGNIQPIPQSEYDLSSIQPAPKIFKEDCKIDWNKDVTSIFNHIRGLSPYPAAWTNIDIGDEEKTCKIFKTKFTTDHHEYDQGRIDSDGKTFLHIYCGNGYLSVLELQLQGKKRMKIEDFLRGNKVDEWKAIS